MLLTMTTNVYAITFRERYSNTIKDRNEISNSIEDEEENVVSNKTNKRNNKNEISNNTIKNEVTNSVKEKSKNEVENKTTKDNTDDSEDYNESIKKSISSRKETINKDIVEYGENLEYKNLKVNGNIFVTNSDDITFDNIQVNGDIMLLSNKVKIENSEISGSVYILSDELIISNSELTSLYSLGNFIKINEGTEINRELTALGSEIILNGKVGRDFYSVSNKIDIQDDAKVVGKATIKAENKKISDSAKIKNLDFEKLETSDENNESERFLSYFINKGIQIGVILLIVILLFSGFPKFIGVNNSLSLKDFFKAFFTGLLEFIILILISIILCFTGYGVGYGLLLLNISIILLILGKIIFIISFGIRLINNKEKSYKAKVFITTIIVAIILGFIEMISFVGTVGFVIDIIINVILAFTGLGTLFRVIFTRKKKMVNNSETKIENNQTVSEVIPNIEIKENVKQEDIHSEIKAEIKEEIEELKKEREEDKKINEEINNSEKEESEDDEKE